VEQAFWAFLLQKLVFQLFILMQMYNPTWHSQKQSIAKDFLVFEI